jgi:dipeptidyl aminopeptidase/acylaminoacyl peptidase
VLDRVNSTNFGYPNVTADHRGTLVVQHWEFPHQRLEWIDRHGGKLGVAVEDFVGVGPSMSPDGSRVAYDNDDPEDLFVRDLRSGTATRLTFSSQSVSSIVWSRDGRTIAFSRLSQSHGWEVYTKAADGGGPDSLVFRGPGLFSFAADWAPDGRWMVAACTDSTGQTDLWRVPLTGGPPELYQHTPEQENGASLSPDGHWLAYGVQDGSRHSAFVQSFPQPGTKYQVAGDGVTSVNWAAKGNELLTVTDRGEVFSVPISLEGGFHQGAPVRLFKVEQGVFGVGVLPGEQRILIARPKDATTTTHLEVVLGWPALLEQAK